MCLHQSSMREEWCTRCNPLPRAIHGAAATRSTLPTSVIIHDAETSRRFDELVVRIKSCLVFQHANENQWGFVVNTTLGRKVAVSPTRYALSRAGRFAAEDQILKCSCERVGDKHGNGLCVNPDHLIIVAR